MRHDEVYKKALKSLKVVFDVQRCKGTFDKHLRLISHVQRRIRDVMATKDSKIEVLRLYWEKNLNKVMLNATMQKDEDVVAMCKLIMQIPKLV
jgi:hypothetical protein